MKMFVTKLNSVFALLLVLPLAGACTSQPPAVKVRLSSVEKTMVSESSEFVAGIESLCSPTLKPSINGRVNKIFSELGDRVTPETTLMQVIPTQLTGSTHSTQSLNIAAPCAGVISNILVSEGENVNTSTPLIAIVQTQPLELALSVPLERATQVKLGTVVELINLEGQSMARSEVASISPQVVGIKQSILVKARFDNAKGQFRPGQLVRARLLWNQRPGILIPTSAVIRAAGRTLVFVAQPKKDAHLVARQKHVELSDIQGTHYLVISGLQPGEKLIISGVADLFDGASITPE